MSSLIELKAAAKTYGGFTALDDITLSLSEATPSMTAIAGESGSGKTTLARMMLGFIPPSRGAVFYRGKDVDRRARARLIQPVFQDPFDVFNPFYRVDHVLTTPLRRYGLAHTDAEARKLIDEALRRVGLRPADTLGRYPHELSGGQRQRVMVARAVLLKPRLIVADEPVSMVDASLRATILDELRTLNRELDISIVYITHDLTTAFQICDNIVILYRGAVAEAGSVERVIGTPRHPYSQLLVSSIPLPDLSKAWGGDEIKNAEPTGTITGSGCKFAGRCPHVMARCWDEVPPNYLPDSNRLAACFLHADAPVAGNADISAVFRPPDHAPAKD